MFVISIITAFIIISVIIIIIIIISLCIKWGISNDCEK